MDIKTPHRVGLIGGMSWESSALYYKYLNRQTNAVLGGNHNARSVLVTLDFEELLECSRNENWDGIADLISEAGCLAQAGGAAFMMITAMTGHVVANQVAIALSVPLLHAGDALVEKLCEEKYAVVGVLGTSKTLTGEFLETRLRDADIKMLVPGAEQMQMLDNMIFEELTRGVITEAAGEILAKISADLVAEGAEVLVLACTELPLVFPMKESAVPVIDLVETHVAAAVNWSLKGIPQSVLVMS